MPRWRLGFAALWLCPLVQAQEASPNQGLLGDWGGVRTRLGFAGGRTRVNPRVELGQPLLKGTGVTPPVAVQNAEYPFELFYSLNLTHWLSASPLIQYIARPGGTDIYTMW